MQAEDSTPRIGRLLAWTLGVSSLVGMVVRLTVKDAFPIVSVIFYATPTAVLCMAMSLSALLWQRLKHRGRSLFSMVLALACCVWWYQTSFVRHSSNRVDSDICVVFWNIANGKLGWTGIVDTLTSLNPDVVGLVEVDTDAKTRRRLHDTFPNYKMTDTQGGMVVLCRGDLSDAQFGTLDGRFHYKQAKVVLREASFRVFVIDVKSNPLMFRRQPLTDVAEIASKFSHEPVVIMGDFNTPGDSVHFRALRSEFVNAFESYGNGYSATWPLPVPVLQLDHIWTNRGITVSDCQAAWSWRSDHRLLIAHLHP